MSRRTNLHGLVSTLSVAAAMVAATLAFVEPAGATPAPPALLSPTGGAAVASNSPVLSWSRVAGATKYDVWVDDDPAFASPTKQQTVNRRWAPTTPLGNGEQYWQVRSYGSDGTVSAWSGGDFAVGTHAGPALVSPPNDPDGLLELIQPDTPPLLSWTPVPGATGYTVEVDDDDLFLDGERSYATKTTSMVVPDQKANGTYYWRVTAAFGTGISSLPSDTWTYHISPLPEVTGAQEVGTEEDVVLDWDTVPGAKSYNLWVSTDPNFNGTSATVLAPTTTVYSTRFSPKTTFANNDTYYWKVRAVNADGEAKDWPAVTRHEFARRWTDKPTLLWPPNTLSPAASDPFYYQWTPVDHATYYELQVGSDPNFSSGTFKTCTTASTTYAAGYLSDSCMPTSQGTTYYWRVRAIDDPAGVQGIYDSTSNPHKFTYDPGPVVLIAPLGGVAVDVPTLSWQPSRDVDHYAVTIKDSSGKVVAQTNTPSLSWTPDEALDPTAGPFSWGVQPSDSNNAKPVNYGTPGTFSLTGNVPSSGRSPLTPITGISTDAPTTRFPSLSWEPYPGAAYYKVLLRDHGSDIWHADGDPILSTKYEYPAATSTGTRYLTPGQYDWIVTAYNASDVAQGSGGIGTFTITDLPVVTNQRVALSGDALRNGQACAAVLPTNCKDLPATPVLAWDPVPGAAYYKIFIAQDPDITNYVYGSSPADVPKTVNTYWTPTMVHNPAQLPDSTAGVPYYWYVLPCKASNVCNPDPTSQTDQTAFPKRAFEKLSPAPQLSAPAADETVPNDVTFSWVDYLTTSQATTWAPGNQPGYQAGRQYRIQVGTQEANFEDHLVDNQAVDQLTYTPYDRTYPEGNLYWRVQAIDGDNNGLAWSSIRHFFKQSPIPVLSSPVVVSPAVGGSTPFRWSATPYAGSYRLEVYKNNDTTFSSANRVVSATTKQTAYTMTSPLPPAAQPYLWRVQRLDAQSKAGSFTSAKAFVVSGGLTTLTAPASGATVGASDGYFSWTAVASARRYQWEYRKVGSTSSTKVTTSALAYAPTSALAAATYEWRVHALDANDKDLGATDPWRRFTVPVTSGTGTGGTGTGGTGTGGTGTGGTGTGGTGGTGSTGTVSVNGRPYVRAVLPKPGAKVKPRVRFRITFSESVTGVTSRSVKLTLKGKRVKAILTVSADRRTVTLKPKTKLKHRKTYRLSLSAAIRDLSGLTLRARSWKFKVK